MTSSSALPIKNVAVGVLVRTCPNSQGVELEYLLAQRPPETDKPYSGFWEFPGGKFEPGETAWQALVRELKEELNIEVTHGTPWIVRDFAYPHATVRLHFWRVSAWEGELQGMENQAFDWFKLPILREDILPGTIPVLKWLALPPVLALSNAGEMGVDGFLNALDLKLEQIAQIKAQNPYQTTQVWQLLLREPNLSEAEFSLLFHECIARTQASQVNLLVSSRHPEDYWHRANGVHLTSRDLLNRESKPNCGMVGASIHDLETLTRANILDLDYAMLGHVLETPSHPDRTPLGWQNWRAIASQTSVPLLAVGGLEIADLSHAHSHGAHGIALMRKFW